MNEGMYMVERKGANLNDAGPFLTTFTQRINKHRNMIQSRRVVAKLERSVFLIQKLVIPLSWVDGFFK